ncbi:hypothetical protein BC833DRAFT_621452 [Globomyces pollinis-pini]|nr:hypothetical protein BC833DRAFT_621452 [Globomyces pollinis-pini]
MKFTFLEIATFAASTASVVFILASIVVELVKNRAALWGQPPSQLLFLAEIIFVTFHISGITTCYFSAISFVYNDSYIEWSERVYISMFVYKMASVLITSVLFGVFSYAWTSVNAILPNRKLPKIVATYSNLIAPVIYLYIFLFIVTIVIVGIKFSADPLRFYFTMGLMVAIFHFLIGLLLVPIIIDLAVVLKYYFKVQHGKSGKFPRLDQSSFSLIRCLTVAILLLGILMLSTMANLKHSDISYIFSQASLPKYSEPKTEIYTQFSTVIFSLSGFFTSFLTLGKLIVWTPANYDLGGSFLKSRIRKKNTITKTQVNG